MVVGRRLADRKRKYAAVAKVVLHDEGRDGLFASLRSFENGLRELGFASPLSEEPVENHDRHAICLTGRFYNGILRPERDLLKYSTRFGLSLTRPQCLRVPRIVGDDNFPAVSSYYNLAQLEPDLLILLEADRLDRLEVACRLASHLDYRRCAAVQIGENSLDGVSPLGYADEVNNLQGDECAFVQHVYSPPMEGVPGGTYVVFRRYALNLERWISSHWSVKTSTGEVVRGQAARNAVVGRTPNGEMRSGNLNGEPWPDQTDRPSGEGFSHAFRARPGRTVLTQFDDRVATRNAAVYRRGFVERVAAGLHPAILFVCYQANIQRTGFEFIHNEWLMASGMFRERDALLDPKSGFVIATDLVYAFVPKYHGSIIEVLDS